MQASTNEIYPVAGSILSKDKRRLNRVNNRKSASSEKQKTVMWDINSIEQQKSERRKESLTLTFGEGSIQSEANSIGKALALSTRKKGRRNSTRVMSNISQSFKLLFDDELLVEVIAEDGSVKKEKKLIKESCVNDSQFNKARNQKYFNEYVKAAEFFSENPVQEECDEEVAEDTVTNTLRNQYVGKLALLDSGAVRAPYKYRFQLN